MPAVGLTNQEFKLISKPVTPVTRFSPVVGEGEHAKSLGCFQIDYVVREALHGRASHGKILWDSRDPRASVRKGEDLAECGIDLVEALKAQSGDASLIPPAGLAVFDGGFVLEPDEHCLGLPQGSFRVSAYLFPGSALRFARHDSSGSPFDLAGPGLFHNDWILDVWTIETGQKFSRKVRPLVNRQSQGFTENRLRS